MLLAFFPCALPCPARALVCRSSHAAARASVLLQPLRHPSLNPSSPLSSHARSKRCSRSTGRSWMFCSRRTPSTRARHPTRPLSARGLPSAARAQARKPDMAPRRASRTRAETGATAAAAAKETPTAGARRPKGQQRVRPDLRRRSRSHCSGAPGSGRRAVGSSLRSARANGAGGRARRPRPPHAAWKPPCWRRSCGCRSGRGGRS